jgi:hypothetical protein
MTGVADGVIVPSPSSPKALSPSTRRAQWRARRRHARRLGALFLEHAAPLLTIPIVYLVRAAIGRDSVVAAVELHRQRALLRIVLPLGG